MFDIYDFLALHAITYQRVDHEPVFTCEEAVRLLPPLHGTHTKNLFLRDRKGKRYFLIVVGYEKNVDLKELRRTLEADTLSFASPERLKEHLGVEPGSATILGLVFDAEHRVEVVFDESIWTADALHCHPLVNTATLSVSHEGIQKFLQATGHTYRVVEVPERKVDPAP